MGMSDLSSIESSDESVRAKTIVKLIREFPIVAQKCICCLATKQTVTVMQELAAHLTDKQNDGLLRRPLEPRETVKGLEGHDAEQECVQIAERKGRALAGMVHINYCDLLGFLKQGMEEPKFKKKAR